MNAKPGFGQPCNHCGLCCHESLCGVGEIVFGEMDGPCPAIQQDGAKFLCGIMVSEAENFPVGQRMVANTLGAGCGCGMADEDTTDEEISHFDIYAKMKTHRVNPIDRSYAVHPSLTVLRQLAVARSPQDAQEGPPA